VPVAHAAFTTLGAIALHGFRLAQPQLGERVGIIGLGLLGQLSVQIARAAGCRVFGVDLSPERVALAREMGADVAVVRDGAEAQAMAFSGGVGCDVVLITADATSNDPIELAGAIARDRAQVVAVGAVGLSMPRKVFFAKELNFQISRSYGPGRYDPQYEMHGRDYPIGFVRWTEQRNLQAFVELLASGAVRVDRLISHRFDVNDAPRAYDVITGKTKEPFLGVLLTYPETASRATRIDLPGTAGATGGAGAARTAAPVKGAIGVSLVGAGLFANATLLPAMRKLHNLSLRGIVSAQGVTSRVTGDAHSFRFSSTSLDDVLKDAETNAVFILTRHHLHARQTLAALSAGKHVFVEKPLCLTLAELDAIADAHAAARDRLLMVGFNRRFAPLAQKMKAFLGTGEPIVLTYRVNAGFLPPEHWTQDPAVGGGRLLGEGCHFLDFANWIHGGAPVDVFARAMSDAGRYRQDNLVITLTYPSGGVASIVYVANGDKEAGKERIEAFSGGRYAMLDDYRELELHRNGKVERVRERGQADKGHAAECAAFIAALTAGGESPIPFPQLVASMRTTFAAVESLATGASVDPATLGAPATDDE
jgi:predicted dehydrogenase